MQGLMMEVPLTIPLIVRHAEALHGGKIVASRKPDRSVRRLTYAEVFGRARRLATALRQLGIRRGDRVATFCWNHHQHVETYFAAPCMGAVVHTLNILLGPEELSYIANHAGDSVIIVDAVLLPAFERFRERLTSVREVIVVDGDGGGPPGALDYESLIASQAPDAFEEVIDERDAAAMCYTSGTTARPRGVVYSHRSQILHTLVISQPACLGLAERDTVMPVVPMFHANAWGVPYAATLAGANQVHAGPYLDPGSLLELMSTERVTGTMGVPTIWIGILQELDKNASAYDLSALKNVMVGGAAVPEALIRAFAERHGITITQGWGMTETSPVGSMATLTSELADADTQTQYAYRARAGRPIPLVEARVSTRREFDRGMTAAWPSSRYADHSLPPRITTRRRPTIALPTTGGSRRATSRASIRGATSRSAIARRMSSSREASGSAPSRSRTRSWEYPASPRRLLSASLIRVGRSARWHWWSCGMARHAPSRRFESISHRTFRNGGFPMARSS